MYCSLDRYIALCYTEKEKSIFYCCKNKTNFTVENQLEHFFCMHSRRNDFTSSTMLEFPLKHDMEILMTLMTLIS